MPQTVLPILPLRNAVVFPASVVPISVGRRKSTAIIEDLSGRESPIIGVLSQRSAEAEDPDWSEMFRMGTVVRVLKVIKLSDETYSVVLQGLERFRIVEELARDPYHRARVERIADAPVVDPDVEALGRNLKESARQLISMLPNLPKEAAGVLDHVDDPGVLADLVASNLAIPLEEKQVVLEAVDVEARLRTCLGFLSRQLEMLKIKKEVASAAQEEIGRSQREYFLRQQLKAIREELGEGDDTEDEVSELAARIESAGMSPEGRKMAEKQLSRLRHMQPSSAEWTVTRTYLDWLLDTPWSDATADKLDVDTVRAVLDEDHYDLDKVKRRILEQIAVLKLNPDKKGPILCLVGPPGVGKTSLGRSIARAIGREFVRISLGGVRDEAEIRGHRRTYVGALPGRVIQGMKRAGKVNPLFMLDELDKLGADFRGDPSSALLEVLDPEQNFSFSDHYLEVPYDLSKVMFIGTANTLSTIPSPLLDRMEVIEIPGYTRAEKRRIALDFIIPKQLAEHGLGSGRLEFTDEGIFRIIDAYTREAGVRNLEREVAGVCRAVAVKVARGGEETGADGEHFVADPPLVEEILGPERYLPEMAQRTEVPGVATGLAWTPTGGDIIFIEATKMRGSGKTAMTGQLGEVMKESAQTALSYVRANAEALGLDPAFHEQYDVHIHVPAGSVPKDGPSAGVAMLAALVSLLSGRRVRPDVAMTGEITLRGLVLPVGGIKEKVLAAHRAGIRTVVLPERNKKDLPDIPQEIRDDMQILFIQRMNEVLDHSIAAVEPSGEHPGP
jgi:ATP-dependent Lon protease